MSIEEAIGLDVDLQASENLDVLRNFAGINTPEVRIQRVNLLSLGQWIEIPY